MIASFGGMSHSFLATLVWHIYLILGFQSVDGLVKPFDRTRWCGWQAEILHFIILGFQSVDGLVKPFDRTRWCGWQAEIVHFIKLGHLALHFVFKNYFVYRFVTFCYGRAWCKIWVIYNLSYHGINLNCIFVAMQMRIKGGAYLAKPYSAKPYSAVQESDKPYFAKPGNC